MKFSHSRREPPKIGLHGSVGRTPPIISARARATATSDVAPVCPITRGEVPPSQPGIKVPIVPKANDLPSVIDAVNKIIDIIATDNTPTIRWLEKWRTTQIVRITNPDDDNQWVDVERIVELMMEDQVNGDLWYWSLGQPQPPAPSTHYVVVQDLSRMVGSTWVNATIVRPEI
jgi:hypothetical protein